MAVQSDAGEMEKIVAPLSDFLSSIDSSKQYGNYSGLKPLKITDFHQLGEAEKLTYLEAFASIEAPRWKEEMKSDSSASDIEHVKRLKQLLEAVSYFEKTWVDEYAKKNANAMPKSRPKGARRMSLAASNTYLLLDLVKKPFQVEALNKKRLPVLHPGNIPNNIKKAEYAVRGPIVVRAVELQAELRAGTKHPFEKVIMCNIGNPHAVGQVPLTFHRQVLAGCLYPQMCEWDQIPSDVKERVNRILGCTPCGSIGCYSHSQGLLGIRETVCQFLEKRDGFKVDPKNIFLTAGASPGITYILRMLVEGPNDGILIPIPQYPLYSATLQCLDATKMDYLLIEENDWAIQINEVRREIAKKRRHGVTTRAMVLINPGNPTGQVLSLESMEEVCKLAYEENIMLLADEVYQQNIYMPDQKQWYSFKKVLCDLGEPYASGVQLVSFHSVSKGIFGECGLRGGYMELHNFEEDTRAIIYKLVSIGLCSNTIGQIMVDLMLDHPKKSDPSFEVFDKEYQTQFKSLQDRSQMVANILNKIDGITCTIPAGAMYAFPQIQLPAGASTAAANKGMPSADALYCMELLESKGICCVPGSGFGQKDGTFHFRTTILPPENEIEKAALSIAEFHKEFVKRYSE